MNYLTQTSTESFTIYFGTNSVAYEHGRWHAWANEAQRLIGRTMDCEALDVAYDAYLAGVSARDYVASMVGA